jgi:hypothetical protein
MIGISEKSFMWIIHSLFILTRTKPKFDLKKLIIQNRNKEFKKEKDFKILPHTIEFNMKGTNLTGSLFVNILVKEMVLEWFVHLLFNCLSI